MRCDRRLAHIIIIIIIIIYNIYIYIVMDHNLRDGSAINKTNRKKPKTIKDQNYCQFFA